MVNDFHLWFSDNSIYERPVAAPPERAAAHCYADLRGMGWEMIAKMGG